MWLLFARALPPDKPYWPGRRTLSALDAAAWPLLWVLVISHAPASVGLVGPLVSGVALLCGLGRLRRALWVNHRYRFTTWRWGRPVAVLVLIGWMLKVLLRA